MPKHNSQYTIGFVCIVSVCCSLVLAVAATSLRDRQEANVELDIKKNILKAFGEYDDTNPMPEEDVREFFSTRVEGRVIDHEGNIVEGNDASAIKPLEQEAKPVEEQLYPLFVLNSNSGEPQAYAIPIIGKGLWSTMFGYLALEDDLDTIRGITFYKHGETPGLGGEIEAQWFQEQFVGKKILNEEGELVSVTLVKGVASDKYSGEKLTHYVDGMSGATITSKGVSAMIEDDLSKYEPYFDRIRKGGQ